MLKKYSILLILFLSTFNSVAFAASSKCMDIENITDRTVCLDFKLSVEERIAESLYIQHSRANFKDAIIPHDEWIKQR